MRSPSAAVTSTRSFSMSGGRASGLTGRWAAFMGMRHDGDITPTRAPKAEASRRRVTTAPAQPWNSDREVWLLACLALPTNMRYGYTLDPATRTPRAAALSAPDGSWCEIDLTTADDGIRQLREGGPTPLWEQVEHAYQRWHQWNRPRWETFGLTTTATTHTIWLYEPRNVVHQLTETGSLR